MFPGTSLEGGQSRPSRFQENFSDPGLASPSPPGDYPASPGSHGGGAFQNPEGATRSGPPSRLKRPPTSEVGRNPYNASIRPSIIGDNNPGGPFTTVTLSEHNYGSTSRNRGTHRDSLGDASHRTGEQENRSPSISERCIAWSIACSIAFMRIGGQVMPSVGLGFLFLGTKLEYFYVPEFAEDGTHEVWEELYPEPKDHDGGGGGGSKGPSVRWSVMWLAWGLCVLTTVYSAFAYCVFLRHFLTKRDRGWFGPLHAAAELGMFALWFAASMCMTLYVLIPLTKKYVVVPRHNYPPQYLPNS